MKVDVSVGGLWHSPPIIEALNEKGYLGKFYTSRPYFKLPNSIKNIGRNKVVSLSYIDYIQALTTRILKKDFQYKKAQIFDRIVAQKVKPCDIFVVWSSFGVESLKKAKSFGAFNILERGSTHILEQDSLLRQAYSKYNFDYTRKNGAVLNEIIERELEEYELADNIFVPSQFVYDSFVKHGVNVNKLVKIPYGANVYNNFSIENKDFYEEQLRVIFVGEVSLRKGIYTLIEALKLIKDKINVKVVIAGRVNDYAKDILNDQADIIELKGVLSKEDLVKEYKKSHVLILPSVEEGMARVILEGMSYGISMICSHNTGAGDIIKDGYEGFLVDPYDSTKIADKLKELYDNRELLRQFSNRSVDRVKSFSLESYKNNIIKKYESIIH